MKDFLPVRQASISQHLSMLRHVRLVDDARLGTQRCYHLSRKELSWICSR
ncbi:regulatory protein ArsR [Rhodopirellula sallentina SM41]|uniref:Regulatory protein ArsR n=1 Tax=Rhodopirellula sallentina SM41 TaxID=1263870 RepID=M5U563_9BACT|nr:regulatory protein ArsR [Rhodopirellula sallentina SM41]